MAHALRKRSRFNQSESLSGIETISGWEIFTSGIVSTNLNPYQGLKLLDIAINNTGKIVSTNLNPYQGLKLQRHSGFNSGGVAFQPIWIPIRDWNWPQLPAAIPNRVSTNLNPYQGLKRRNIDYGIREAQFQPIWIPIRDWNSLIRSSHRGNHMFQPIWIPIRDWNCGDCGWITRRFVSTNLNPYQGLKPRSAWNPWWISRFNQSESLSGIETEAIISPTRSRIVSTNLNPYQGLKHWHFVETF